MSYNNGLKLKVDVYTNDGEAFEVEQESDGLTLLTLDTYEFMLQAAEKELKLLSNALTDDYYVALTDRNETIILGCKALEVAKDASSEEEKRLLKNIGGNLLELAALVRMKK